MKEMFIKDFGFVEGVNEEEWINRRDPLLTVDKIIPDLPILIIQGTEDNRVSLEAGYNMVSKLKAAEKNVSYMEFEGAKHCLNNFDDRAKIILKWFKDISYKR